MVQLVLQLRRQNTCILFHVFSNKHRKIKYVRLEHVTNFCLAVCAVKELWSVMDSATAQQSLHGRLDNKPVVQLCLAYAYADRADIRFLNTAQRKNTGHFNSGPFQTSFWTKLLSVTILQCTVAKCLKSY